MKRLICLLLLLLPGLLSAQGRFGYEAFRKGVFAPKSVQGGASMNDGEHYTVSREGCILQFDYRAGEQRAVLFDAAGATPRIEFSNYAFSPDERRILLTTDVKPIYRRTFTAEYWIYDRTAGTLKPLSKNGPQQLAAFSPDGGRVAFMRENNLYVADLSTGEERQITTDGRFNHIINGGPDWVYEEEFGLTRAFAWSPDGQRLAWLRFDESRVKQYNMNKFEDRLYPENYTFKYPKAGEENSVVELWVCELASDAKTRVDLGPETDQYIPRLGWTPSGKLWAYRLNRAQNHVEVLLADASGTTRVAYEERNARYLERVDDQFVTWLPDGDRFLVRSERSGFFHVYVYSLKKGFLNAVTSGEWEVTGLMGVEKETLYYMSSEMSPLRRDAWSVRLDGKGKRRLTAGDGTYRLTPSKGFRYFLSYFSNVATPGTVSLHTGDGKLVRVLEDNAALADTLRHWEVPAKEFFTFTTPEGIELNGWMLRPTDFDPSKQYPLLMTQYSGPGSQRVTDTWSMGWEDVLVQRGYLVACVDGRGTGARGEDFKKCTYKQLGKYETEDQIAAARYFSTLPYVDAARIGIYGWSYGGFMALSCILKGNDIFRAAIAVAPVTSWRFYDTIYTELYMGDPKENPGGYDDNSPLFFADRLKGKLLIAHGTADDNVHIQNTYEMVSRLVQHDKPYELLIYPDRNHGMGASRHHLQERCLDFIDRNL